MKQADSDPSFWRKQYDPDKRRKNHIKSMYGIDGNAFDKLLKAQDGKCAICGTKATCIDHDHNSGRIRGLLCRKCNSALGLFGDDYGLLEKASDYLRNRAL